MRTYLIQIVGLTNRYNYIKEATGIAPEVGEIIKNYGFKEPKRITTEDEFFKDFLRAAKSQNEVIIISCHGTPNGLWFEEGKGDAFLTTKNINKLSIALNKVIVIIACNVGRGIIPTLIKKHTMAKSVYACRVPTDQTVFSDSVGLIRALKEKKFTMIPKDWKEANEI